MSEELKKTSKRVFQKYFDNTWNREYYYDIEKGESIWELPQRKK